MELFDKKFVHFMWDDELEGKQVFVADNINSLIERIEKGTSIYKVRWSRDTGMPFECDDLVRYRFAYYDPNYEVKKAFNEGKKVQMFDTVANDWVDCDEPLWCVNNTYRVKPDEEKWIAYLARENGDCYLTRCAAQHWADAQARFGAKTKLFVGAEDDADTWVSTHRGWFDVIKAWEDGKTIQFYYGPDGEWVNCNHRPAWNVDTEYRVKPEEKQYRPYESSAEMIADFIDRFFPVKACPSYCEPLIWLKGHNTDNRYLVTSFLSEVGDHDGDGVRVGVGFCGFQDLFKCYTYLDGSPVGMEC